jgi:uncharacterized protein (TIGR03118 family)
MEGVIMRFSTVRSAYLTAALGAGLLAINGLPSKAQAYAVTKLVSDGFVPAPTIDPSLINPWGMSNAPTFPIWVSDNNAGVATIYTGTGVKNPLTVNIPPPMGQTGSGTPDGQVFNGSGGFDVTSGGKSASAFFMFATEDGTISGWAPSVNPNNAILAVDNSNGGAGAVYKGLALDTSGGSNFLYAANFRGGDVEMYDSNFNLVKTFTDPGVAAGYAPFNVQNLGGELYVSFALQDAAKHDDVAGPGNGYVDVFNADGTFNRRLVSLGGATNSPWGLDLAPASFGAFAGDLLVGNFGDGTISVFNPLSGVFLGDLLRRNGTPIVLTDLWGLMNGTTCAGCDPNNVYFTSGVFHESHGLFGFISLNSPVPEPATWAFMILGMGLAGATLRGGNRNFVHKHLTTAV